MASAVKGMYGGGVRSLVLSLTLLLALPATAGALSMQTAWAATTNAVEDSYEIGAMHAKVDRCRRTSRNRIVCVGGWWDSSEECRQRYVVRSYPMKQGLTKILVHAGDARCKPRLTWSLGPAT